jgi:hypothetical protein
MKKFLVSIPILAIPGLLLSACGSLSLGLQNPGAGNGSGGGGQQFNTTILVYVLLGLVVVIVLAIVFRKKR